MLDGLLSRWFNGNSTNLTSPDTFPMYHIDFESSPSTSNNTNYTAATNASGWTVTATGNNATDAFARYVQDILNRTVTRPVLSDVLYQPIVAAIVIALTFALSRKTLSSTGAASLSWRDALGLVLIGLCVVKTWILEAVALTAAYVAWSSLAGGQWNATSRLPDFDAFLASLRPATMPTTSSDAATESSPAIDDSPTVTTSDATTESSPIISDSPPATTIDAAPKTTLSRDDNSSSPPSEATPIPSTSTPATPNPESATLHRFEAQLGLPERKPEEECVICWTSDENPLRLPCSHLVCEGCLARLRDASRYTCPYCSMALFKPQKNNNKHLLYQAAVATSGAHLAICLTEAALKIVHGRYSGAVFLLFYNMPSALFALQSQSKIRLQGEEVYFAEATETSLGVQLGMSLYLAYSSYGRVPMVDWAAFRDGEWRRMAADDWGFMMFSKVVDWLVGS
ncbi:hypothetical protein Q7P36_010013 [Cladosporium allicinum]